MNVFEIVNDGIAAILVTLISILVRPLTACHRIMTRDKRKRVLLVARNAIAADHMSEMVEILADIGCSSINVTVDRFPPAEFNSAQASEVLGVPAVGIWRAIASYWDLVIYTNHTFGLGLCFSPTITKLYVNHGLHMGKINNESGNDGVYGREKIVRPFNSPYYSAMFAASCAEAEFAIRETPELRNVISVVGYPKADKLLKDSKDLRCNYRESMECDPEDVVLHVISTWGNDSLYCKFGGKLEKELPLLLDKYKVVISLHPRFDQLTGGKTESRSDILKRLEQAGAIVNYGLDWDGYIAAADVVLTDHSSLCLYHVLLQHPMLLLPVSEDQFVEGSTFDRLRKCAVQASYETSLPKQVAELISEGVQKEYAELPKMILSRAGSANSAYREKLLELLT